MKRESVTGLKAEGLKRLEEIGRKSEIESQEQ